MSRKYLGDTLDIHTGGEDNKFPHHECEIAQSEAFTGQPYVRYWVHATHLLVDGSKMSKSKGNFYTIRDLIQRGYHPLAIRLVLVKAHYRRQFNFTLEGLDAAQQEVKRLRECRARLEELARGAAADPDAQQPEYLERFQQAMEDDLNVSAAMAVVHEWLTAVNRKIEDLDPGAAREALDTLAFFDKVLGVVFAQSVESAAVSGDLSNEQVESLIAERSEAKQTKDFARADEIRDQLSAAGIELRDGRDGTTWKRTGSLA
jgi:cysteinyl-tRNA synthetase